jgi:hypothetical protein
MNVTFLVISRQLASIKRQSRLFVLKRPEDVSKTVSSAVADEMRAGGDTNPAPAKKKGRRACYECGIAGHLLSE